jgi:hypothetical protein
MKKGGEIDLRQGSVLIGRLETIFQVMAYYPSNTFELKGVHDEI